MNPEEFSKFKTLLGDEEICKNFNLFNILIQRELAADIFTVWIEWSQVEQEIPRLLQYVKDQLQHQRMIHNQ